MQCGRRIDCTSCSQKNEGIWGYHQYPKGRHFAAEKNTQNCIIFLLKGELLVNSEEYPGTTLLERQFILQAIGSKVELLALTDVEYIQFWFTELPLICELSYKEILENSEMPLVYTPLTLISKLNIILSDVIDHLKEQSIVCDKYLYLKAEELTYVLTNYYPLPQISRFFYPISTYTESFHYFVMQNYDKVKNVEDFAHLGGYATTTFRRLFKNLYGVPVYEWILDKKREGVLNDLQFTNMRISAISSRYGFDSLSHFAHFCKDSFGDTPRALRKRAAGGEKLSVIKNTVTDKAKNNEGLDNITE
ncbi:helix-turn-helix transcriptional regulator [Bacteroidaceae bacterium HV4-6-C5C]|nr:helix-turn-helix transcriptional regulator [Bacteroidaceae bacterium HV4-6-C5C]